MQPPQAERGLSEIVGFVLILAVIVIVAALYLTYGVPAQGREGEIARMNEVKDRFVGYKVDVDSLWSNRQCGTAVSTSFTLGSGGGATIGSFSIIPILSPARSTATLALNQRAEYVNITYDSYQIVSTGGVNESGSISTNPATTTITFITTPGHFLVSVKPPSLTTKNMVNLTSSENRWSAWVNVTPVYTTSWVFNLTLGSGGHVQSFSNTLNDTWNRTDITVSTWRNGIPVVAGMAVFRNITANPATNYTVDLMNPAYGISADLASPQTLYAYQETAGLGAMYLTNYSYWPATSTTNRLLGSLEYRAQNEYWIPQTYYYQMGGVFLEQNDGNTVKVPPSLTFRQTTNATMVQLTNMLMSGSGVVTGSGPAQVTSLLTGITQTPLISGNNTRYVNISVQAASNNSALMWQRIFQTAADQGGFSYPATYTNGTVGNTSWINVSPNNVNYHVQLSMNQVNFKTALQTAAVGGSG